MQLKAGAPGNGSTNEHVTWEWPDFNSSQQVMSRSFGSMPANRAVRKRMFVPLVITAYPMGQIYGDQQQEIPVPLVHLSEGQNIVRCRKCRTYMNPFTTWYDDGRHWCCNMCHEQNDLKTKRYFIGPLDEYGRRHDRMERPELCSGSIELTASREYTMRPPIAPTFLFLFETTRQAIDTGALQAACEAAAKTVAEMPSGPKEEFERVRMAVMCFDSNAHILFASNNNGVVNVTMNTISSAADPYPVTTVDNEDFVIALADPDGKARAMQIIQSIPDLFSETEESKSCFGFALRAVDSYLTECGGKAIAFISTQPTVGLPNCLLDPAGPRATAKSEAIYKPANLGFHQLGRTLDDDTAKKCPSGVEIHAFIPLHNEQSLDLATINPVAAVTGQAMFSYNCDQGRLDDVEAQRLQGNVYRSLVATRGWEACVRVRASEGWNASFSAGTYGPHVMENLVTIPVMSPEYRMPIILEPREGDDSPKFMGNHVFVQVALLYTTNRGERRIRVHNVGMPTAQQPADIWGTINLPAFYASMAAEAVNQAFLVNSRLGTDYMRQQLKYAMQSMTQSAYVYTDHVQRTLGMYAAGVCSSWAFKDASSNDQYGPDRRISAWFSFARMMNESMMLQWAPAATEAEFAAFLT